MSDSYIMNSFFQAALLNAVFVPSRDIQYGWNATVVSVVLLHKLRTDDADHDAMASFVRRCWLHFWFV